MESVPGKWHKQVAVNVGGWTMSLVRFGTSFFSLPPEAKTALQCVHGAEVGVYELQGSSPTPNYSGVLAAADKSMRQRGWERIVGVAEGRQFVAVYLPRSLSAVKEIECRVVVLDEHDLVVVSAHGNPESLLALVREATKGKPLFRWPHSLSEG
jgi:hypothetical protein